MLKIIVAEDDMDHRLLISKTLAKEGYSVRSVSNGKEVLEKMEHEFYDLIVSEIMMPVMDGYELVRKRQSI